MTDNPAKPAVRHIDIPPEQAGRRIDNYLFYLLRDVPKTRIYRILRKGEVRVNGGRVKPGHRLAAGDRVRLPPLRRKQPGEPPALPPGLASRLRDCVLHEDDQLLIINKPAGIPVHGGTGFDTGIIEALRALRPDEPYLELVHRLDRETSGCLMLARDPVVLRELHRLLFANRIDKHYSTLLAGHFSGGARLIDEKLVKHIPLSGERMVQVSEEGKEAKTRMRPVEVFATAGTAIAEAIPHIKACTLMDVELLTGRTHQIRVHAAHTGHPVAGDSKYGDRNFNKAMRRIGLQRLFLHAASLAFEHPASGEPIRVRADLPADLEKVLARLRENKPPG